MSSPFSNSASTYREQGLSVMPCGPGTKFPGRFTPADGWFKESTWQKYCERLPTGFEMELWERWPDAGICLALGAASAPAGKILVAMDIDTDEPAEVAAIRSVLPGSPVAKRGAKGETQFYLANPCVQNRPFNDGNKRRMLDLLAHGRQTVMPPTVHPDTGAPYQWLTPDTLESFDVADLPVLPDDIADRLAAALAPFGYVEPPKLALGEAGDAELDGERVHRALNDAALANLDAWVPALSLYKAKKVGAGYKAVADWRPSSSGRPASKRATNLAIRHDGIKDCGENKGYTPLDLVMAACQADLETAFRWLQERVAPAAPILMVSNPRTVTENATVARTPPPASTIPSSETPLPSCEPVEPSLRRTSPKGNLMGLRMVTSDGERVADPPEAPAAPVVDFGRMPMPPGLLGDIVAWMNAATDRPSAQLNLGAAIAFLGAITGRRFAHPSRGARTNFLCVGVARTGFGKDHPLTAIERLAEFSNVDKFLGPEEVKSESALRKVMEEKNTVCCLWDELGRFMHKVNSPRASTHESGLSGLILKLFSKANKTYRGAEAAAEKAMPILNPNLCIFGVSTPRNLYDNLSSSAVEDGFLPRWLVFDADDAPEGFGRATASVDEPPPALRTALHQLLDIRPKGNLNGTVAAKPIMAEWGPGAEEFFRDARDAMDAEVRAAEDGGRFIECAIKTRTIEHGVKLSLLYAISVLPAAPVITIDALRWGFEVATISAEKFVHQIGTSVADNDAHAEYLKVKAAVMKAGRDGLMVKRINKMVDGRFNEKRLGEILSQLASTGEFERGILPAASGGRPTDRIRWLGAGEVEAA